MGLLLLGVFFPRRILVRVASEEVGNLQELYRLLVARYRAKHFEFVIHENDGRVGHFPVEQCRR